MTALGLQPRIARTLPGKAVRLQLLHILPLKVCTYPGPLLAGSATRVKVPLPGFRTQPICCTNATCFPKYIALRDTIRKGFGSTAYSRPLARRQVALPETQQLGLRRARLTVRTHLTKLAQVQHLRVSAERGVSAWSGKSQRTGGRRRRW